MGRKVFVANVRPGDRVMLPGWGTRTVTGVLTNGRRKPPTTILVLDDGNEWEASVQEKVRLAG